MRTEIIVINGGSSSGKTSAARRLQQLLPPVWLRWSIDDLVGALPTPSEHEATPMAFSVGGAVAVRPPFRQAESAWVAGIAAMARAGAGIILDDVFLNGSASQQRLRAGLRGLQILWVGMRCASAVATAREASRGDRPAGMAALQARMVHLGVVYDVEVDSTHSSPDECARLILASVRAS